MDIVLCYSILEKCKSIDVFSGNKEAVQMVWRIRQHRMVLSERLMEFYEKYFEKKGQGWLEWYQGLCTDVFYTTERSQILDSERGQEYIKENPYHNELIRLCRKTEDKIILLEPKRKLDKNIIKKLDIGVFDSKDVMDVSGNNAFSMYTLPVNGKSISEGEDSKAISKWLGRFLQEENYIQIFDNYLLTKEGIAYLKNYILRYVQDGAQINIYSCLNDSDLNEQQVKQIFQEDYYKKWMFSIWLVKSKKDSHARSIEGSKYIIQIDRGLSVFGRSGKTFQTVINIFQNNGMQRTILKESQLSKLIG